MIHNEQAMIFIFKEHIHKETIWETLLRNCLQNKITNDIRENSLIVYSQKFLLHQISKLLITSASDWFSKIK